MNNLIDPQDAVDYLIAHAKDYAIAESMKVFKEEMRKTIKAECMKEAEQLGHKTAAMQEREAYASPRYKAHLEELKDAVYEREHARWMMIAAQERINVWRSQNASNRGLDKLLS